MAANAGALDLTAAATDITEQSDKRLAAKSATLTLSNTVHESVKQSLIQETVPGARASHLKFQLTRTPANAAGELTIQFENPRNMELKKGTHQAIVQVSIGKPGTPGHSTIVKQLDIRAGRYDLPVTFPRAQIADSKVGVTLVTIQKDHDAWVKSFFQEGQGTQYPESAPPKVPRCRRFRW
ncbi:MAG: hypothetical protein ACJ8C4_12990 [Gemmataceae bacterium]